MDEPKSLTVVPYGGGVNTIALLILLRDRGIRPAAIIMANPGSEWRATMRYRDEVARPWLARNHMADVAVVTREEELRYRDRAKNYETLAGLCKRTSSLPSVAYGWKKCSLNYKAAPQLWWAERQSWAQAEWDAGRKIIKCIGYDAGEDHRVRPGFNDPVENSRYVPSYPLYEAGLDRDDCVALIVREGLPVPRKSACTFCPNNTLEDWEQLRIEEPDSFAAAVEMSRRAAATVEIPDVVGLMRCSPHGRRQLHVWTDGGYSADRTQAVPEQTCECHE